MISLVAPPPRPLWGVCIFDHEDPQRKESSPPSPRPPCPFGEKGTKKVEIVTGKGK